MRDEPALRRQWALICALTSRRRPLTVREMAGEAGVSLKTVRRDLELFRSVGFPLEESTGEYGRKTWKITGTGGGPPLSFAFDEAAALYLGRRLLDPLAGTPFGEAARSAFQKIRAALGPTALEYLARFASVFHHTGFHTHDYARRNGLIADLQVAIEDGKTVNLLYRSERATRPSYREVHPYGLVQHGGALYLVALDPVAERVKHYKVDRIDDAEVTGMACRRPEGFDLADHLRS
jgi:predicted DNA-binding transcriptional regulator YafY